MTLASLFGTLAFRKRIGRALGRMLFQSAPGFLDEFLWETVQEPLEAGPKGGVAAMQVVKRLRPAVAAQLEALAPALIVPMLKAIKINVPKDLPINPKTGQIDLLAPIASKLLSGKKVNAWDLVAPFIPTAMQVGQVIGGKLQEFVGGLAGAAAKAAAGGAKPEVVITDPDALIQAAIQQ